jgi:hypothetical protein
MLFQDFGGSFVVFGRESYVRGFLLHPPSKH